MDELNEVDKFYVDHHLDLTTPQLSEALGKSTSKIETYLAGKWRENSQRSTPRPTNQETVPASTSPLPLEVPVDKTEVTETKKSLLRDAFARKGTFTAMTSSAGMISDEIFKKNPGNQLLRDGEVITTTGR